MTSAAAVKRALATTLIGASLIVAYYNWSTKDGLAAGRQDSRPGAPATPATPPAAAAASSTAASAPGTRPQATAPVVNSSAAGTTIAFDPGSARLRPDAKRSLVGVFNQLSSNAVTKVQISGYTDDSEDPQTSLELSIERARAVADYLLTFGMTRDRLVIQGFGSTRPITDNATENGRLHNNRVEIIEINARP